MCTMAFKAVIFTCCMCHICADPQRTEAAEDMQCDDEDGACHSQHASECRRIENDCNTPTWLVCK